MAVVEAAEVELEGWAEADGAIAAAGPRLHGEDTAAVAALRGRRAIPGRRAFQGQVTAGPAEWFRTGASEEEMRVAEDLKRRRGRNPGQRVRPRPCRPRLRRNGLPVARVGTREGFLIWRRRAEAPEARAVNLPAEPRVVKAASLPEEDRPGRLGVDLKGPRAARSRAERRPGSPGADFREPRAVNLGADWVKQAQLPGE